MNCMRLNHLGLLSWMSHSSKSDLRRMAAMHLRYIDGKLHDRGEGNVARIRSLHHTSAVLVHLCPSLVLIEKGEDDRLGGGERGHKVKR